MLDAREKSQTAAREASASSPDVFERTVAAAASLDSSPVFVDDRFDLHRQFVPTTVAATSSGWDVDPAQVGLGFGLGILLAIGLALAVRFTRVHRPAH